MGVNKKRLMATLFLLVISFGLIACRSADVIEITLTDPANKENSIVKQDIDDYEEATSQEIEDSTLPEKIEPVVLGEMYTTTKANVRTKPSIGGEIFCALNGREIV